MNKLFTFAAAAALLAAASSCSKDDTVTPTLQPRPDGKETLLSQVEQQAEPTTTGASTRTELKDNTVIWSANDQIQVINSSDVTKTAVFTLSEGGSTTEGIFIGDDLGAGGRWTIYPASSYKSIAGSVATLELPAGQTYAEGSFGKGANPMAGQRGEDKKVRFQNLCGVVKLQLTGSGTVSSIRVVTAGEKIAGAATVDLNYDATPEITVTGSASVALTDINKALSDVAQSFYIVIPYGTYAAGLTFEINMEGGQQMLKTTTKAVEIKRSLVTPFAAFAVKALNFPDAAFRAYLSAATTATPAGLGFALTADGTDIDVDNAANKALFASTTVIGCVSKGIKSLKGVEYFTALTNLSCQNNQLTTLDVTSNTALTALYCYSNQLATLDVTKNTALTLIGCSSNQLTTLDITSNTALRTLNCTDNRLTTLDVTSMAEPIGYALYCGNQKTADGADQSLELLLQKSQMDRWTVQKDKAENLNVLAPTITLCFPDPSFRAYLTAAAPAGLGMALTTDGTDIDIYNATNSALLKSTTTIDCSNQTPKIASLKGIEYFTALTDLNCYSNQLTSLDVLKNTALTSLNCYGNQLTSLNVSKNTALITLYCYNNQLTSLNVSKNTALTGLQCYNNRLTTLDARTMASPTSYSVICGEQKTVGGASQMLQLTLRKAQEARWTSTWANYQNNVGTVTASFVSE